MDGCGEGWLTGFADALGGGEGGEGEGGEVFEEHVGSGAWEVELGSKWWFIGYWGMAVGLIVTPVCFLSRVRDLRILAYLGLL